MKDFTDSQKETQEDSINKEPPQGDTNSNEPEDEYWTNEYTPDKEPQNPGTSGNEGQIETVYSEPSVSPAPPIPEQDPVLTIMRREMKRQKSFLVKVACVFCALALLLGCSGGLAISTLTNSAASSAITESAPVYFNNSTDTTDHSDTTSAAQSSGKASSSLVTATTTTTAKSMADVVASIENSVVAINVTGTATDYFNREYPTEGSGSGVIISTDGIILTNNHVISGGNTITVFLKNGTSYKATVLGSDKQTDLAVLKITASGLTAAKIGDSGKLRVGDTAIAIGNPLGELQGTVTAGIISALSRSIEIDGYTLDLMQTDTAINPGNSGGGLFNSAGELIGLVTAKTSETGIEGLGFVIPINNAIPIANQLMTSGYVTGRPTIGLTTVDITDQRTAAMNGVSWLGTYVYSTASGSPAEAAGLRTADYIVSVDGKTVSSSAEVTAIIKAKSIGDSVKMVIRRSSGEITVTMKVVEEK